MRKKLFGHSHIQWSYQSADGKKTLLNPGSCGLPLDCIKEGVPYTILEISENGVIVVEEKRVPFPMEEYIEALRQSDQFTEANVWSKVVMVELRTKRESILRFLSFAEKYADKTGDDERPFSISTWERTYEAWEHFLLL